MSHEPVDASVDLKVDVAIIGGGVMGVALALGLAKQTQCKTMLIDAKPGLSSLPSAFNNEQPNTHSAKFDNRTIALAHTSVQILQNMGVSLDDIPSSAIKHIHVSDQGHAGQVNLHAHEHAIDAFGRVVSLATLGEHLYHNYENIIHSTRDKLPENQHIIYRPATTVGAIHRLANHSELTLSNGEIVHASLVVLAEGGSGELAKSVGLVRSQTPYHQHAVCFTARCSHPHEGWAYERFTEQGPLAFLPLSSHEFGVVWTVSQDHVEKLRTANDSECIAQLQAAFGYRQGLITSIGKRDYFELSLRTTSPVFTQCAVAVGNAAQSLHPIAGQGANLGLRDVDVLVKLIAQKNVLSSYALLSEYCERRRADRETTIAATDGLVRLFSNNHLPLVVGRNFALTKLNVNAWGKNEFARYAMGMHATTLTKREH
jgi:2-octaprenyl-6-methoxyphenol hydroxylase